MGRLGNKDDTYGETQLGQQLYNENRKTFYFDSMISMFSNDSNDNETTKDDDAEFGLRQLNLQAKGFVPKPRLANSRKRASCRIWCKSVTN
ncbi:hypothetical protein PEC302110_27700 [Pectobacterium araliae]|uniref:Uncharacterized protein n=1 Tax=Pectobacterium araliae TaxID=3073862 RepID=A0AAN0KJ65_9GAMM|nr:hypothetical protein PEC302110_27700 [Pectobacterium sp. MAFF 302110]